MHQRWPLRPLLCWLGRHAFEVGEVLDSRSVILQCSCCPKNKVSKGPIRST